MSRRKGSNGKEKTGSTKERRSCWPLKVNKKVREGDSQSPGTEHGLGRKERVLSYVSRMVVRKDTGRLINLIPTS